MDFLIRATGKDEPNDNAESRENSEGTNNEPKFFSISHR